MNPRLVMRRLLCACGALLLLALSWWTLSGGVRNVRQAMTLGQEVETAIQLAGGLLCLAVVVTRFRWRPGSRPVRVAWLATQAVWVALSALVWGPPQPLIALLFAALSLLLAWALLWALGPAVATAVLVHDASAEAGAFPAPHPPPDPRPNPDSDG